MDTQGDAIVTYRTAGSSTPLIFIRNALAKLLFVCGAIIFLHTQSCIAQDSPSNNTLLIDATMGGDVAKVKTLLRSGANPNISNASGVTPLMFAAMQPSRNGQRATCNLGLVSLLLQQGANVKAAAKNGFTALIGAATTPNLECVQTLLKAGSDVKAKTSQGHTALLEAAMHGEVKIVVSLIQAGAELDGTDQNGRTALLNAVSNSVPGSSSMSPFETIAIVLLQAGANPNISDRNGQSPLTLAAANGATVVVYPLLEHHANVDVADPTAAGGTPLIIAADHENVPLIKELLRYHPDLGRRDQFGKTALAYAKEKNQIEIITLLTEAGAKQ